MDDSLQAFEELRQYILSDLRTTGTIISSGAHADIVEVLVSSTRLGAAKRIRSHLQHSREFRNDSLTSIAEQFAKECQLLASIKHPNIVEFIGIHFFPGDRLPALVTERLHFNLHDLLDPPDSPSRNLPLSLKCSILCDVANGLAHLHSLSIIHRDLSARNVVLTADMRAKLVDLGTALKEPIMKAMAVLTAQPGCSVYMPPEACSTDVVNYDRSIDIFSLGVLTIFTISENFPGNPLPSTYPENSSLVARSELDRREEYMKDVEENLNAFSQLREDHPLLLLIHRCLENDPPKRPDIHEVKHLLEKAKEEVWEKERHEREQVGHFLRNVGRVFQAGAAEQHGLQQFIQVEGQAFQGAAAEPPIHRDQLTVPNFGSPYGIALSSTGKIVITEYSSHCVSTLEIHGQKCERFVVSGDMREQMKNPAGIAVDVEGSIYVSCPDRLLKFNSNHKLVDCVDGEFDDPRGMAIYQDRLYVSDRKNHRIQVFALDLKHIQSIGCHGKGKGEFDEPFDVTFDADGNMYVAEFVNNRVQVFNPMGDSTGMIGEGEIGCPSGLHVARGKLFVCDYKDDCIVVYDTTTGDYIKTVASRGTGLGELTGPYGITSYGDKLLVCESGNNRIHIFSITTILSS